MSTTTIDVRNLPHPERQQIIFPSVEGLATGEELRILFEFEPLPLVSMLGSRGSYEVSTSRQDPDTWVLSVQRTGGRSPRPAGPDLCPGHAHSATDTPTQRAALKDLLRELKSGGVTAEVKARARSVLSTIDAMTLGMLEQELLEEGVTHDEIRHGLCDVHLELMGESLAAGRVEVAAPHPVHTFMEEHRVILESLERLAEHVERLTPLGEAAGPDPKNEELRDIAHHLVEAESHHAREEEVLFPALERHGIYEPPKIMRLDHVEFRAKKKELFQTVNDGSLAFGEYRRRVIAVGGSLCNELKSHIFKEDNILYQMALKTLTEADWQEVKKGCDKIGYCCFTPEG